MGTLTINSLSNFQVYNGVSLTEVVTLSIRLSELTHLMTEICTFDQRLSIPLSPDPGNHHSPLCFYELNFLDPHRSEIVSYLSFCV